MYMNFGPASIGTMYLELCTAALNCYLSSLVLRAGRYEDTDHDKDAIKAMLKVLLRKLDRASDADVPQPRVYHNDTRIQHDDRNTDLHTVVSRVYIPRPDLLNILPFIVQDYLKFIVRSTYVSDWQRTKISIRNILS